MPRLSWRDRLAKAFAVTPEADPELEARKDDMLDDLARAIVERRMAAAALMLLETMHPLANIGSQFMAFLQPYYKAVFKDGRSYDDYSQLMEDRANVKLLIKKIEKLEEARTNPTEKRENCA